MEQLWLCLCISSSYILISNQSSFYFDNLVPLFCLYEYSLFYDSLSDLTSVIIAVVVTR